MQRFNKVLFVADGADGEKAALRRAFVLAADYGFTLTVMDVVEQYSTGSDDRLVMEAVNSLQAVRTGERKKQLEKLVNGVRGKDRKVKCDIRVVPGRMAIEVIHAVLRDGFDLVVKAPKGNMGLVRQLFGSQDLQLMRQCPCPVWLAKPGRQRTYSRILAAVDPSADSKEAASLDRYILGLAAELAEVEQAELHVVHVQRVATGADMHPGLGGMTAKELASIATEVERDHRARLDRLLEHQGAAVTRVHFRKGEPADVIRSVASRIKADLLVMGTVARSGVAGLLIGNTAERVLNSVRCSVLTVKPEGFKTPVHP